MLAVSHIRVELGGAAVLDGLSLKVAEGETLALLGPSGCGKSTLLRAVVGLVPISAGSIRLGELDLARDGVRAIREHTGFVVQDGGLFPHMTAMQNLMLAPLERGRDHAWSRDRAHELAEMMHLDRDLLARFPGELSGGQRQRVALARGLFLDPDLLLLDEPLGALDPVTRHSLQNELRDLFRRLGKTVVLVTHDLPEAAFLGDRIALMHAGAIEQEGTAEDLERAPANEYVRRFITAERARAQVG